MSSVTVPLREVAHGRSGDKGNRLNISVIAYSAEVFPVILEQVTEVRVRRLFRHRGNVKVKRYVLKNLDALNLVLDGVLEGGVNSSLNVDTHGKTSSFLLLSLPIKIEKGLLEQTVRKRKALNAGRPIGRKRKTPKKRSAT